MQGLPVSREMHPEQNSPENSHEAYLARVPGDLRRYPSQKGDERAVWKEERNHRAGFWYSQRAPWDAIYPTDRQREDGHEGRTYLCMYEHEKVSQYSMEIQEVRVSRPEQFFHLIIFKTHMSLDKTLRFDIAGSIRHMRFVLTMNLVTRKGPPPVKEMSLCLQSEAVLRTAFCFFVLLRISHPLRY